MQVETKLCAVPAPVKIDATILEPHQGQNQGQNQGQSQRDKMRVKMKDFDDVIRSEYVLPFMSSGAAQFA